MDSFVIAGSILIVAGAIQGLFLSIVLLALPHAKKRANIWLALFLLSFSLTMPVIVLHQTGLIEKTPALLFSYLPVAFLQSPFLFLYIQSLIQKNLRWKAQMWFHFIPFLFCLLLMFPIFFAPSSQKLQMLQGKLHGYAMLLHFIVPASLLQFIVYFILIFLMQMRHARSVEQFYSVTEGRTLGWVRWLLVFGVVIFSSCVLISYAVDPLTGDTYSNLLFSVMVYAMAYKGLKQPELFTEFSAAETNEVAQETVPAVISTTPKYERTGLTEQKAQEALLRLQGLMLTEKPFLQPDLNLKQLAEMLGLSAHQLSQLLNQYKQQTFFDFINHHRIEHFKLLLKDPSVQHLSLLGLALESGFNSKAAFNTAFKKFTGLTPSEYKKAN